jgi:DUF2914 family protein/tetratricopeptide repeat protein
MTPSTFTTLRDPWSIIEEAKQAATEGHYIAAEALLREAAAAQEASLGPLHPDLANTLNNLGIVCEMNDHPADAERCFRRAVTIATTVLEPDHPCVVMSRQNLRDFCAARGRPIELPLLPPAPTRAIEPKASRRAPRKSAGPIALNALGPVLMLAMILAATLTRVGSTERAVSPPTAVALPEETTTPGASALDSVPRASTADPVRTTITETPSAPTQPTVIKAELCITLEDWLCEPADLPVTAGPLFFYTQVKSTRQTMIQHRWYRDDRLTQSVDLPIQASPAVGYRSFSRLTMDRESAGSWRIELRSEDGALLHEERFTVR